MEPVAPAIVPSPTTELMADLGNISDAVVNILALHAWWAAAAKLTSTTADHGLLVFCIKNTGSTHTAYKNMAVLRARYTGMPRLINQPDKNPPSTLPNVAIKYMVDTNTHELLMLIW